jgi:hypothetical protein
MEKTFFLGRQHASFLMAKKASSAEARLIHLELAGRYAVEAASSDQGSQGLKRAPMFASGVDGETQG